MQFEFKVEKSTLSQCYQHIYVQNQDKFKTSGNYPFNVYPAFISQLFGSWAHALSPVWAEPDVRPKAHAQSSSPAQLGRKLPEHRLVVL